MKAPESFSQAEQAEQLRRDAIAFDQWYRHRERWFTLRFTMGWVAVVTLPIVCIVAAFVILNYEQFGARAVTAASGALLAAVALLAAAWRRILSFPIDEEPPTPKIRPPDERKSPDESAD
ncbi:MAG TPA: hypothetical protein VGV69_08455 [Solirubrobacterales bacterium]|nr:hypothetical protein [Solirubrobacterales bacterium]